MNSAVNVTVLTTNLMCAHYISGLNPIHRRSTHLLFVNALHSLGQTVYTGGKPDAVFQGGDACQRPSRADVPPAVGPEEEKGVGSAL